MSTKSNKNKSASDPEFLKVVREDIIYLQNNWSDKISDVSLRNNSNILRKLICDDYLARASRELNVPIKILVPKENIFTSGINLDNLVYFQDGGAVFNGLKIEDFYITKGDITEREEKQSYEHTKDRKRKAVLLSHFLKRPAFVFSRIKIFPKEVILYVANKKGGNHYDGERGDVVKNGNTSLDLKFKCLDKICEEKIALADKDAVYFQLLSIGQRLVHNKSVQKLNRVIREHLAK